MGGRVHAALEKNKDGLSMSPSRCTVQWCPPVIILDCRVRTGPKKYKSYFPITPS
jgi:hypothetical protein